VSRRHVRESAESDSTDTVAAACSGWVGMTCYDMLSTLATDCIVTDPFKNMTTTANEMPSGPYASDEKQEQRKSLLYAFLAGGAFTAVQVREFIDLWNDAYAENTRSNPLWCVRPRGATDDELLKACATNLADKMKNMWWYDLNRVTDVVDLEILKLVCVQCGYMPMDTKEECWEFLGDQAYGPMDEPDDLPEAGIAREVRSKDEVLPAPPVGMCQMADEGSFDVPAKKRRTVESAGKSFEDMTPDEMEDHIKGLEKTLRERKDETEHRRTSPNPEVGVASFAALLSPLVTSIQSLADRMESAEAKAKPLGAAAESLEQKAARRLIKLTKWDAHLAASEKLTDAEMAREEEEDGIRQMQEVRKKIGTTPMIMAYNLAIDEQTNCKVKVLRCNTVQESDDSLFSVAELQENEAELQHYQRRLRSLRTKIATISKAMKDELKGKHDVAQTTMEMLAKEECGDTVNPTAKRIHDAAKAKVKDDCNLSSMQVVASFAQSQSIFQASRSQMQAQSVATGSYASAAGATSWQGSDGGSKGGKGGSKGGGAGGKGGLTLRQSSPRFRHVDGEVYHVNLKGYVAPDPFQYPQDQKWDMSGSNQGIVHRPTDNPPWPGKCECGQVGHQRSECPADKWTNAAGLTQVNWRWLFKEGHCTGMGKPK
jgi:hypothetical protein